MCSFLTCNPHYSKEDSPDWGGGGIQFWKVSDSHHTRHSHLCSFCHAKRGHINQSYTGKGSPGYLTSSPVQRVRSPSRHLALGCSSVSSGRQQSAASSLGGNYHYYLDYACENSQGGICSTSGSLTEGLPSMLNFAQQLW